MAGISKRDYGRGLLADFPDPGYGASPMREFFLTAGVFLLGFALRSFGHAVARKSGVLAILAGSFLGAYFLGGESIAAGTFAVIIWFLLPWIEIAGRGRRLRLPLRREIAGCPEPARAEFPHLGQITREIELQEYEPLDDLGWEFDTMSQFIRPFIAPDGLTSAALCLSRHDDNLVIHVALTTRAADGRIFRTTNLPFSESMALPPEILLVRDCHAASFAELLATHVAHLARGGLGPERCVKVVPAELPAQIEADALNQIDHNLRRGLIAPADATTFRYSWRGCFFLWWKFIADFVRLA